MLELGIRFSKLPFAYPLCVYLYLSICFHCSVEVSDFFLLNCSVGKEEAFLLPCLFLGQPPAKTQMQPATHVYFFNCWLVDAEFWAYFEHRQVSQICPRIPVSCLMLQISRYRLNVDLGYFGLCSKSVSCKEGTVAQLEFDALGVALIIFVIQRGLLCK